MIRNGIWVAVPAFVLTLLAHADAVAPKYTVKIIRPGKIAEKPVKLEDPFRNPSSGEQPQLVYVTFSGKKSKSSPRVERISARSWRGEQDQIGAETLRPFTDGMRFDRLMKLHYANTRSRSNSGLRHLGCFQGDAAAVVESFFGKDGQPAHPIRYLENELKVSYSEDEYVIGVGGTIVDKQGVRNRFHFRLPSCDAPGKDRLIALEGRVPNSSQAKGSAQKTEKLITPEGRAPAQESIVEQGFGIEDEVKSGAATLPRFNLRADYDKSFWNEKKDRPWQGMDLTDAAEAEKFANMMLDYFYANMIDQDVRAEHNLVPEKNKSRYWCHMPWLQAGASGREAIHGMTRERPMIASPIYPDATFGTNWGVAFYNSPGCQGIQNVFGTAENPSETPDFRKPAKGFFPEGTVAVKTLFTTANFPALKGAFTWKGNVTTEEGSNDRSIASTRLVQIDIAVKDSTLKGTRKDLDHWLMLTYYYDAKYSPGSKLKSKGPEGWLKMRPQGIQLGLEAPDTGESLIFAGSVTNGNGGRLNGPADNPKSSCLGCHGTSGTRVFMAPGFMLNASFQEYRKAALDFSQQLALAKRNYESRARD